MAHHPGQDRTHASPLAVAYAQSVLDLANQNGQAEAIGEELAGLKQIVEENPSFREVLTNPSISEFDRGQLLDRVFRSQVSPLLFNTLGVLNQHGRLGLIDQIASAYDELLDQQVGKVKSTSPSRRSSRPTNSSRPGSASAPPSAAMRSSTRTSTRTSSAASSSASATN